MKFIIEFKDCDDIDAEKKDHQIDTCEIYLSKLDTHFDTSKKSVDEDFVDIALSYMQNLFSYDVVTNCKEIKVYHQVTDDRIE